MDKNTVYILQKDCLDAKAGDEFEFSESSDCYSKIGGDCQIDYLSALFVENNPEWFKPKEEVNESKPTEQFQWTDELVKEMVSFLAKLFKWNKEQSIGFSEQFKKSKSKKEEPQWEILEFEHSSGKATFVLNEDKKYFCEDFKDEYFTLDDLLHNKLGKTYNITNVKRLSDGEVFSVGDKVISDANIQAPHTVIDSITIVNDYMIYFNSIPFDRAIKVKLEAPKEEQVVKLYTESELLQACRDAFDESRIMFRIVSALPTGPQFKHLTFEDYINSLK